MYMCMFITSVFVYVYMGLIFVCIYLGIVFKKEHVWVSIYCISCTCRKYKKKKKIKKSVKQSHVKALII